MITALALLATLCIASSTGPQESDLRRSLAGAWKRDDAAAEWLGFFGERVVIAHGTGQQVYSVEYGDGRIRRTPLAHGPVLDTKVTIDGERMVLVWPGGKKTAYTRVKPVPDAVRIDPISLTPSDVTPERIVAIREELRTRAVEDQAARRAVGAAIEALRERAKTPDALQAGMRGPEITRLGDRIREVDADNTRRLLALVRDVGWIDATRFGDRAARDAFLIVQHSGNLLLMRSALPHIESDARRDPKALGGSYALLFDRTRLSLGEKQRYGSQLTRATDGALVLQPLEEPDGVDARRATMGLEPLEDYLKRYRARGERVRRGGG